MQCVTEEPNEKKNWRTDTMTTWPTSTWHAPEPESSAGEEGSNKEQTQTESEEDSFHKLESEEEPNVAPETLASSQSQQPQQKAPIIHNQSPKNLPKTLKQDPLDLDNMSKEIWVNLPKEFTGEWNDLTLFLQDVDLYLKLNSEIYNNVNKRIVFTLSFLTNGPAKIWK